MFHGTPATMKRFSSVALWSSIVAKFSTAAFLPKHLSRFGATTTRPSSLPTTITTTSIFLGNHDLQQQQQQQHEQQKQQPKPHVIVVGKIIVDEYGHPDDDAPPVVSVGGGGPQAAMGAALALAARDYLLDYPNNVTNIDVSSSSSFTSVPPKQPVTFMAAVGDLDFSSDEQDALEQLLQPALQRSLVILRGIGLQTPRIRLWHQDQGPDNPQVVQWYAVNDSFGDTGAGGLWGQWPALSDYTQLLDDIAMIAETASADDNENNDGTSPCTTEPSSVKPKPILHLISEGGAKAPGENGDSKILLDAALRKKISFLGIEPILFPNEETGHVSREDAVHCAKLLQDILDVTTPTTTSSSSLPNVVISPDMAGFEALSEHAKLQSAFLDSWAVRNGPKGSLIVPHQHGSSSSSSSSILTAPAATLKELVNPTGAGNAYAAAYTALRGSGCGYLDSACLATGVGAVFCEYAHCPPYTWAVIQRVVEANQQVRQMITERKLNT